jgi:hypothetical protein
MTYHTVCNKGNRTETTSRAGTAYPSTDVFSGIRVAQYLILCVVFLYTMIVIPPLPGGGGVYCFTSVRLSVLPSFRPSVRSRYFPSHFSQQLSMAEIWYLVTSFIYMYVCHIVGSVFGPVRFLLPVCRFCWFLYTFNVYICICIFFVAFF